MKNLDSMIANYYACLIITFIIKNNFFENLKKGVSISELSEIIPFELDDLMLLMNYIHVTTGIIDINNKTVVWSKSFLNNKNNAFRLFKYLGAYNSFEPASDNFLTQKPENTHKYLTMAYKQFGESDYTFIFDFISEFKIRKTLELGCGLASFTSSFLSKNSEHIGIAVDNNSEMIRTVRNMHSDLIDSQKMYLHDICSIKYLDSIDSDFTIDLVFMKSFLNSFSGNKSAGIKNTLVKLKSKFPNAKLVICEYLSKLNSSCDNKMEFIPTLNHDFIQIISRQGTPPCVLSEWDNIYKEVGLKVIKRKKLSSIVGINQFIDVVC